MYIAENQDFECDKNLLNFYMARANSKKNYSPGSNSVKPTNNVIIFEKNANLLYIN